MQGKNLRITITTQICHGNVAVSLITNPIEFKLPLKSKYRTLEKRQCELDKQDEPRKRNEHKNQKSTPKRNSQCRNKILHVETKLENAEKKN